tara:strand:- start:200 stop:505 length:306 start_codon:yes stop_codon:yes gene_type:complete
MNKVYTRVTMPNKRYYKLRLRLKETQDWIENFLEVERHKSISREAVKQLNKDKPILGFMFMFLYLPSRIMCLISDMIWCNRYRKAQKEIEIIKKEIGEINE